jgi:peptidoglycan/xylan/chitin deacetylase (PgdA/CDA1 family)
MPTKLVHLLTLGLLAASPAPFKARLMRPVQRLAHRTGVSGRLARGQPVLRVMMLHGAGGADYPESELQALLEWLPGRFRVVPLGALVDKLESGQAPDREVALTFDDGLRNQAQVVYPLLKRLGLPATFFVCPALLDGGRWLWNHEARERLRSLDEPARAALASRLGAASASANGIVEWMKARPSTERRQAEEAVRAATERFTPSASQRAAYDLMSWDELLGLDPGLVTVGSHSLSHPILTTLNDGELEEEIDGSRRRLEQRLGRRADLFCYPNGSHDARVHARVAAAYRAAVTTRPGAFGPGEALHRLPRIPVDPPLDRMAWRMYRPTS